MSNKLVAYFSASGVTKDIARRLAKIADADIYEIVPEIAYTEADLDWMDNNSRSSVEMKDLSFRPAMTDTDAHIDEYDVIYLGFPIWWYIAPTIINTFLEKYDFKGKTIVLFATAGSSGLGKTVEALRSSVAEDTVIKEGKVFHGVAEDNELKQIAEQG